LGVEGELYWLGVVELDIRVEFFDLGEEIFFLFLGRCLLDFSP
jgi:hypothetical protein